MRVEARQKRYGFVLGLLAFLLGWGIFYLLGPSLEQEGIERWLGVTWLYLSAHYISISGVQLSGLAGLGTSVDLVEHLGVSTARAIPPLVLAVAGVLANDIIGYTSRMRHLVKNTASVLIGYGLALLVAYLQSMADPGTALLVTLVAIGFGAVYLGSTLVDTIGGIPIVGMASVGTLAVIGLMAIVAGVSLVVALWPAVVMLGGTVAVVSFVMYLSRNAPT